MQRRRQYATLDSVTTTLNPLCLQKHPNLKRLFSGPWSRKNISESQKFAAVTKLFILFKRIMEKFKKLKLQIYFLVSRKYFKGQESSITILMPCSPATIIRWNNLPRTTDNCAVLQQVCVTALKSATVLLLSIIEPTFVLPMLFPPFRVVLLRGVTCV